MRLGVRHNSELRATTQRNASHGNLPATEDMSKPVLGWCWAVCWARSMADSTSVGPGGGAADREHRHRLDLQGLIVSALVG
jgi:hypothetical protein